MQKECYRCNRTSITPKYPMKSNNPLKLKAQKELNISTSFVPEQEIQCCIKHISPLSREILHEKNVFERYEYQFLNYISLFLNRPTIETVSYNDTIYVNGKAYKYDLFVSDGHQIKDGKTILLIEIDEHQHWNRKEFEEDREREQVFHNNFPNAKRYILRIRVGEKNAYCAVDKRNIGAKQSCYVKPSYENQFKNNMNEIKQYIKDVFNNVPVIKHAYIDFSNSNGIQNFPTNMFDTVNKKDPPKLPTKISPLEDMFSKMNIGTEKPSSTCTATVKSSGNICGRKRPCRYHDK